LFFLAEILNMAESTIWWVLAAIAVSAELLTGTFYLLMLALGLAGGAVAAHLGLSVTVQLLAAAVLGSGAVAVLQKVRPRPHQNLGSEADADVHMDVGQTLHVDHWADATTTQASYRGAMWAIELMNPQATATAPPTAGRYRIREVVGNVLRVEPV
jgi:membrane protein implicated in regulation of membrane protease activity